jgi:hypothetical protein
MLRSLPAGRSPLGIHDKKKNDWIYGILFWGIVAVLGAGSIFAVRHLPFFSHADLY